MYDEQLGLAIRTETLAPLPREGESERTRLGVLSALALGAVPWPDESPAMTREGNICRWASDPIDARAPMSALH